MRRTDPLRLICLILFLASAVAARANETVLPLQLEVDLNGQPTRTLVGFQQGEGGRFVTTRGALSSFGIVLPGQGGNEDLIGLDAIAGLTFSYDEARQKISITVPASALKPQKLDARAHEPRKAFSAWGAALDYNFVISAVNDRSFSDTFSASAAMALDGRIFTPHGLFETAAIAGTSLQDGQPAVRLGTSWLQTDELTLTQTRYGDAISGALSWTRPIRHGGFQIQRNFALQPEFVTAPLPVISGSAAVPSTVDVYVNNVRTFSRPVDAGPFTISNVPILGNAGVARIVVQDATGRVTETTQPFFTSATLLREGMFDYSFDVGLPRRNFGVYSFDYALDPVAIASGRYGWSDKLTLEGHAEVGAGTVVAGAGAVFPVPIFLDSLLTLAGSASSYDGHQAARVFAGLEATIEPVALNIRSERMFGNFVDLATASMEISEEIDRTARYLTSQALSALDIASVSTKVPLIDGNINLTAINSVSGRSESRRILGATYTRPVGDRATVFVTGSHQIEDRESVVYAGVNFRFDDRNTLSVAVSAEKSGASFGAEYGRQASPGDAAKLSWRASVTRGATERTTASGWYQGEKVDVQGLAIDTGRSTYASLSTMGSFAYLGERWHMVSRLDDGFAVVDVGHPGVPVKLHNRKVAETGEDGRAFVTGLMAHQLNKLVIDPTVLPPDTEQSVVEKEVVPKRRSGVLVDMRLKPVQPSALVQFVLAEGEPVPPGSVGRLTGVDGEFIVGYDGQAFIPALGPSNAAIIQIGETTCQATFAYAPRPGEQVQIEKVICR
jgi:outer membrane usher protein